MSVKVRVNKLDNGAIRVSYGDKKTSDVTPKLMKLITAAGGDGVDASSPEGVKDTLIGAVKAQVANSDHSLLLQLSIYGRAVLEMPPRDLTHVTLGIPREACKPYLAICTQMGKQAQKMVGAR